MLGFHAGFGRKRMGACLALGCAVALYSFPAHAYIDPGSGSLVIQAIVGALAAGAVAIKFYFWRLVGFFSRKKTPNPADVQTERDKLLADDLDRDDAHHGQNP